MKPLSTLLFAPGRPWLARLLYIVALLAASVAILAARRDLAEARRKLGNCERLRECDPAFAVRASKVITELESRGFRPVITES